MRFTHTADCHLGGQRNQQLRTLTEQAFETFVTGTIEEDVDFCLIAGDLFNTAIPGIETLKFAVTQLGRLRQRHIPVYAIAGSHDYSPSGKSMLGVLERAGLLVDVSTNKEGEIQYTKDEATGVLLAGISGRRGMLDQETYAHLKAEPPKGAAIFLFHTALEGRVPNSTGLPEKLLPKGFTYYAGGHVHIVENNTPIVYPGPLFPNSFSELEELRHGGYWLYDEGRLERKEILLKQVIPVRISLDGTTGHEANARLLKQLPETVDDAIVLLRVTGRLASGSITDLNLTRVSAKLLEQGAYAVLRNTAGLHLAEFTERPVASTPHDMEEALLREHREDLTLENQDGLTLSRDLLKLLSEEQREGERQYEYEERVVKAAFSRIGLKY